jgi:hydrogenase maturation protease
MIDGATNRSVVVVAGFGSPNGDDRAGWQLIERLGSRVPLRVAAEEGDVADNRVSMVRVRDGTALIHELDGCRKLIVIDACRGSGPVGTISRFRWPDARIRRHHDRSTHEIGVCSALELAEQLGKLPPEVEVFGIEIADDEPMGGIRGEVLQAIEKLAAVIAAELGETVYA